MAKGDSLFLALAKDRSALVVITPTDGTIYNQLLWLFDVQPDPQFKFSYQPVGGNSDAELDFAARSILDALDIDVEEPEADLLDRLTGKFGTDMPPTATLSELARRSIGSAGLRDDPDGLLLEWMERETQLFRRIERRIVTERLERGFIGPDGVDVDSFNSFSLSVQNRRKARAGLALESHIAVILDAHEVAYSQGAITENRNKPDFLFPGAEAYHAPTFPRANLTMLGAKSTLKDRWRQVLSEAERITLKHLLTLEPGISQAQTDEMKAKNLQLVIPFALHRTFKPGQLGWLMNFAEFIGLVKSRQK